MGNPEQGRPAPAAPTACVSCGPSRRPRCQFGDQCFRKNSDHKKECSHPGDLDWDSVGLAPEETQQEGYQATVTSASPCAPEAEVVEERGLLGAVGGAAAAWGGMKVTGADENIGFLGRAGLIVGAAVAGHMLQDHLSGGKKGKKSKKDKKSKKSKKDKKSKSRELDVADRGLPEEDSDSDSSSADEESPEAAEAPGSPSVCWRPRCEFSEKCFRRNGDHKKLFSHPDDSDWVASGGF